MKCAVNSSLLDLGGLRDLRDLTLSFTIDLRDLTLSFTTDLRDLTLSSTTDLRDLTLSSTTVLLLCLSLLFLLGASADLFSQEVYIYGYLEPQLMGTVIEDEFYQLNTNKLRIDLESDIGEHAAFGANFDFINYYGKTEWNILEYLPDSVSSVVPPEQNQFYNWSYNKRVFLDNAYLKFYFKHADLTLGKQQLSLGTGYAWNPTDLFNSKNMLDPTYEQPGHNAIRLDIPVGKYSIVMIYTPEDKWQNSGKLLRIKGRLSHFDYSVIAIEKRWTFTDYSTFTPVVQKRRVVGGDFVGELLGLGVWGEFAYSDMEKTENFYESVVGLDYTFRSGTYLMCEYYRNTLAKTDYKQYGLNEWMRFINAETKTISRDQVYALINHPVTDLIKAECSIITSLNDRSLALIPRLSYNIFENVNLVAYLNLYFGKEGKSFASNLGNAGVARARVYF